MEQSPFWEANSLSASHHHLSSLGRWHTIFHCWSICQVTQLMDRYVADTKLSIYIALQM